MTRRYPDVVKGIIALLTILSCQFSFGQYFGQNKPKYKDFDFRILQTPHFDIYHYLHNDSAIERIAQTGEYWYHQHQEILKDTFDSRNPVILYNHHADFQQTAVIGGLINVSTGGVTEGLRNRVIMPVFESLGKTRHVLGHELVHAFQYHLLKTSDSTSIFSSQEFPLWMVEGLAEYLSRGIEDPLTSMWMRDAVLSDNIPSVEDMSNPYKYFPYRYGHALWAYIAHTYGDSIITPLFLTAAKHGYEKAFIRVLKVKPARVSDDWKQFLRDHYRSFIKGTTEYTGHKVFLDKDDAGDLNVSPSLSPDGKYIAFLSEKNIISLDLYIANLETGEIIERITSDQTNTHIDNYNFLESQGTWSPDGKKFAYVIFSKGRNKLLFYDVEGDDKIRTVKIPEIESFSYPSWSPDGQHIALTGLKEGVSDLYLYNIESGQLTQLTDDPYGDVQPSWSTDGKMLVYSSEDPGPGKRNTESILHPEGYRLYTLNIITSERKPLQVFPEADNLNPVFSPNNGSVYFLSNADGFRNIYEYELSSQRLFRLTSYFTGVSGISELAPALSVARLKNQVAYTVYRDNNYILYEAEIKEFEKTEILNQEVSRDAAFLVPIADKPLIDRQQSLFYNDMVVDSFTEKPYKGRFGLTYAGGASVGVGASTFGAVAAGGMNLLFTDILNDNQLLTSFWINGELQDFAGQVAYLNRKHRIYYGAAFSHFPYRSSFAFFERDTISVDGQNVPVENLAQVTQRVFEDRLTLLGQYPLSRVLRFEAGASFIHYSFSLRQLNNYFHNGEFLDSEKEKLPAPESFNVEQAHIAYVGDNADFGLTSPLQGFRYRFQIEKMFDAINTFNVLADYRRYWFYKPLGFAVRGIHYARHGRDSEELFPLFVGSDYLVRGYNIGSFEETPCERGRCLDISNLTGSRIAVGNAEVRLPFSGPEKLALFKSGFLFTDLVYFVDGGLAWNEGSNVEVSWDPIANARTPVFSSGISLRVNFFNMLVLEPYYAKSFQRNVNKGVIGFLISAGGW